MAQPFLLLKLLKQVIYITWYKMNKDIHVECMEKGKASDKEVCDQVWIQQV